MNSVDPVDLDNYLVWRLVVSFYPSKYGDNQRRRELCLKQTEDVFGPVRIFKYIFRLNLVRQKKMCMEIIKYKDIILKLPWINKKVLFFC